MGATDNNPETLADVDFTIPNWASKAPNGTHLDVYKGEKLLQKLMIDEKRCYFFGRNPQLCDIAVEHASCSRVHAALVYHKYLNRFFLFDLGSAHGTFIANVQLEAHKAEHLQTDQIFRFGASTRRYVLREKPTSSFYNNAAENNEELNASFDKQSQLNLNLPEKEEELENLTEYNTALNRRIASLTIPDENFGNLRRKKGINVNFREDEDIINPEDVDPSIGKFRNLIQTVVVSAKRPRIDLNELQNTSHDKLNHSSDFHAVSAHHSSGSLPGHQSSLGAKLGLSISLNIAPEVELYPSNMPAPSTVTLPKRRHDAAHHHDQHYDQEDDDNCPKKKKYAKEAWPGKKPSLLI